LHRGWGYTSFQYAFPHRNPCRRNDLRGVSGAGAAGAGAGAGGRGRVGKPASAQRERHLRPGGDVARAARRGDSRDGVRGQRPVCFGDVRLVGGICRGSRARADSRAGAARARLEGVGERRRRNRRDDRLDADDGCAAASDGIRSPGGDECRHALGRTSLLPARLGGGTTPQRRYEYAHRRGDGRGVSLLCRCDVGAGCVSLEGAGARPLLRGRHPHHRVHPRRQLARGAREGEDLGGAPSARESSAANGARRAKRRRGGDCRRGGASRGHGRRSSRRARSRRRCHQQR